MDVTERLGIDEAAVDTASDALSVLAEPTRLRILLALATSTDADGRAHPLTFTELRRAVGVEDTGRFNYHLGEVTDAFVTAEDDAYRITEAGLEVVSLVASGLLHEDFETVAGETDYTCVDPGCENALEATFDGQAFTLSCPLEQHTDFTYPLAPSAAVGRSLDDLVDVAIRTISADMEQLRTGRCPFCDAAISLTVPAEDGPDGDEYDAVLAHVECPRCWLVGFMPVGLLLVRHPAVIAWYHDHGRDVRDVPLLDLSFVLSDEGTTLRSTDPVRIDLTLAVDDASTVLTVDADLALVEE